MVMLPVVLPVSKRPPQKPKLLHVLHCQASLETMRKRRKRKLVLTLRRIVLRRLRVEAIKQDQDQQRSKGKLHLHLCLLLTALPFLIPVHPYLLRLVLFLSALPPPQRQPRPCKAAPPRPPPREGPQNYSPKAQRKKK